MNKKSRFLYTFSSNKSYTCLLNVEPSNLVSLKTYNTDEIIITFTDKNGRTLEIEHKCNFALFVNK